MTRTFKVISINITQKIQDASSLYVSIGGFSAIKNKLVLHFMTTTSIPIQLYSFRLGAECGSVNNVNAKIAHLIDDSGEKFQVEKLKYISYCN